MALPSLSRMAYFYPRPLRGGRPFCRSLPSQPFAISIHALCEEGDQNSPRGFLCPLNFYPRPLRGGRPANHPPQHLLHQRFLSTPSARRATSHRPGEPRGADISIHALCEEGDPQCRKRNHQDRRFLSTPSARRATNGLVAFATGYTFLSTPSARRATGCPTDRRPSSRNFYPRPLRGGRHNSRSPSKPCHYFYPRPLRGGRPTAHTRWFLCIRISIHALCEEGDFFLKSMVQYNHNFYPRPLRGGRPGNTGRSLWAKTFLSTPSARRATLCDVADCLGYRISIHALCEEGDAFVPSSLVCSSYFYPRPLRGGRLADEDHRGWVFLISIHALCEEGDPKDNEAAIAAIKFLSTPSARRATGRERDRGAYQGDFYPRPLRGGRPNTSTEATTL